MEVPIKNRSYHILNGDCLLHELKDSIDGNFIIMREALIDGPADGRDLTEFYKKRSGFITERYKEFHDVDYYKYVVPELEKISEIPEGKEINLWFGKDLFCQINLWFCLNLIRESTKKYRIHLVLPYKDYEFSFDSPEKTPQSYLGKRKLLSSDELENFSLLWKNYKKKDIESCTRNCLELSERFHFMNDLAGTFKEYFSVDGAPCKAKNILLHIIREKSPEDFNILYMEFQKAGPQYGLGDTQVKLMLKELTQHNREVNLKKYL